MPSATATTARVPAWQRLGLKLKSAQPAEPATEFSNEIETFKRNRIDEAEKTPSKKAKTSSKTPLLPTTTGDPTTPKLTRKKSVTFTPETKAEDGDSIRQLFNTWVAEQKSQDPLFQLRTSSQVFDAHQPPEVEEHFDISLNERERRVRRVKELKIGKAVKSAEATKPKKSKTSNTERPSRITKPVKTITRPFLTYLRQYHESRDSWKFNKNHQNHLLKHVFDKEVIPSDHAHLIYEYVGGLQGGVRTRLRDAALSIKVKDQEEGAAGFPDNMADRDKRQNEYEIAMNEYVATMTAANASSKIGYEEGVLLNLSDAAMASRVAKRMRAEQILAALGRSHVEGKSERGGISEQEGPNGDDDSQKRLRMNDGSTQKVARKRKQRTTAVDEDNSSSDESSDSDSSSASDRLPRPANHGSDDSSSSSSTSSSNSESEEESEDDEEDEEDDEDDEDDSEEIDSEE